MFTKVIVKIAVRKNMMRFGVIADPQYADKGVHKDLNRDYHGSLVKLRDALDYFNTQKLEFVVMLGDFVDDGSHNFQPVLKLLGKSKHKIYPVFGNHDYVAISGDRKALAKLFDMGNTYYSWSQGGYRFVVLDTNDGEIAKKGFSHQKECELEAPNKEDLHYIDYWLSDKHAWNGYILKKQQAWLKGELAAARRADEKVVLFGHDPLYPIIHDKLRNADEILRLLGDWGTDDVVGYFAGHYHNGSYAEIMRTAFITFKAMVLDNGTAYSMVELDGLNVKTQGFGTENSYNFVRKTNW
jgi:3',5'-cyclic AMP phosphodiesterase CpdA